MYFVAFAFPLIVLMIGVFFFIDELVTKNVKLIWIKY